MNRRDFLRKSLLGTGLGLGGTGLCLAEENIGHIGQSIQWAKRKWIFKIGDYARITESGIVGRVSTITYDADIYKREWIGVNSYGKGFYVVPNDPKTKNEPDEIELVRRAPIKYVVGDRVFCKQYKILGRVSLITNKSYQRFSVHFDKNPKWIMACGIRAEDLELIEPAPLSFSAK